ncbi:MAG: hypothetical protein EOQ98_31855 [Mesorhizobium sp.]|uniref:hypothetical protein n=1 Tax=Mesorhizobium sp. TaxID=1871066 RepID=UPI000FEAB44E|nr:hypothetical protein [Mesorhizobium sp.]RWO94197.1 MAG: hypothetical protein EOQ98_31855 [Mesorhizobium sp.]
MALAVVTFNGERLEDPIAERPLIATLRRHRQLREQVERLCRRLVECETESRLSARLEMRLNELLTQEEHARDEMLRFAVESIEDCAAKAEHLRWLLNEGDSGLEDADWHLLLQSFVNRTPAAACAFP